MKIDLEIMDLFQELEEIIENAPLKGLTRKSISLDKEEVLNIISDIKSLMPEEVNQAIWINRERQRIITEAKTEAEKISVDKAVPVQLVSKSASLDVVASDIKLTKIEIITDQDKFKDLKDALNEIGIMGMTVSNVLGCGTQKGAPKYYRGIAVEMELHPKILVEIVVAQVPVQAVIDTAKEVLYTGYIGDGKIFVSSVENAVKIRTGEEGVDALQYPEAKAN